MIVTVTGATGLIGRALVDRLIAGGHMVRILGRSAPALPRDGVRFWQWDALSPPPLDSLEGAQAVVNLAGEPIAQRWTPAVKQRLHSSRTDGTRNLVAALSRSLVERPAVLVSASAIGYYGSRGDTPLGEEAAPGLGFLPDLCVAWEEQARAAEAAGMRVARLRIGVVLSRQGGALARMLPIFRLGIGGRIGAGRQWMSWIHLDDLVGLFEFALSAGSLEGAVNATAPNPVTNAEFTRALARALHRPAVFPVPALALKLLYGEMSGVVLASARVLPRTALRAGYSFRFPELAPALADVVGRRRP